MPHQGRDICHGHGTFTLAHLLVLPNYFDHVIPLKGSLLLHARIGTRLNVLFLLVITVINLDILLFLGAVVSFVAFLSAEALLTVF
jgi:hypothetical protein